jgi:hypothetical protein
MLLEGLPDLLEQGTAGIQSELGYIILTRGDAAALTRDSPHSTQHLGGI